jgi:sugar phosphate isomerase/epimerase
VNLALSSQLLFPRPLDPAHLASIRSAGFEWLELVADGNHFPYRDMARLHQWKQAIADAGLQVSSVLLPRHQPALSPDGAARERAMDEHEAAIDAAEILGARIVILQLGAPGEPATDGQSTFAEDAIARLSGFASPRGLELACENMHSAITRVPTLATAIENVGRSMVGICVDVGTAQLERQTEGDILNAFRAAGRELYHIQLSDASSDGRCGLPLGQGVVDWSGVRAALHEVQYAGFLTIEVDDPSAGASAIDALFAIARDCASRARELL